jgi:type IV pilus assembly protein PilC
MGYGDFKLLAALGAWLGWQMVLPVVLASSVIGAAVGIGMKLSAVARWTRTLATMFAAGVPLVEALDSVGGASGNAVFAEATEQIQRDVSTGTSLTTSMQSTGLFPVMVLQMASIGEESGSLDHMLGKAADFYEEEVDEAVKALSSLMEPFIIVILGTIIGGIVVSMYLPIFKLGEVV